MENKLESSITRLAVQKVLDYHKEVIDNLIEDIFLLRANVRDEDDRKQIDKLIRAKSKEYKNKFDCMTNEEIIKCFKNKGFL